MKLKNNKNDYQLEALIEDDSLRNKYSIDELKVMAKAAYEFTESFDQQSRRRRREDRRHLIVKWIGGILAFVGINGLFVIILYQTGIIGLLIDKWEIGYTLFSLIIIAFYFSLAFLLASTFFWLSDRTGFHYLIEDWVISFYKYKKFPRNKRRAVIKDIQKKLCEISEQLYRLEFEADAAEDEKLSESVESLNQVIGTLVSEADISSRSLIHQPEHASWKGFILALEETSNDLELELKDIAKYHSKIQPLLKNAANIISNAFYWVIDYCDGKKRRYDN